MRAASVKRIALAGLAAAALAAPWLLASSYWLDVLSQVLFLAVLGQAWNILGGYGGQYSFGNAVFFGTGAYLQIILQTKFGWSPWLALWAAILAGTAVAAAIGYLSFRYGLRGSYFALITLAFAEAFRVLATSLDITEGGKGIYLKLNQDPERALAAFQFSTGVGYYYAILALAALSVALALALERTRFGAGLVAVRENEDAAEALGVNAFRVKLGAICLAGMLTACAGVFYVQKYLLMEPNPAYGPEKSVEALVVAIIGGLGTPFGPLLGAGFLHLLGEAAKDVSALLWVERPGFDLILYGVVLILVLAFLPDWLAGLVRRLAALARRAWTARAAESRHA